MIGRSRSGYAKRIIITKNESSLQKTNHHYKNPMQRQDFYTVVNLIFWHKKFQKYYKVDNAFYLYPSGWRYNLAYRLVVAGKLDVKLFTFPKMIDFGIASIYDCICNIHTLHKAYSNIAAFFISTFPGSAVRQVSKRRIKSFCALVRGFKLQHR